MPTGLWSKPLLRPPGKSPNASSFDKRLAGHAASLFNFCCDTPRVTI